MSIDIQEIWAVSHWRALIIVVGAALAGFVFRVVVARALILLTSKTHTEVDDKIVEVLNGPIFWSVTLAGAAWAIQVLQLAKPWPFVIFGVFKTLAVIIWTRGFSGLGTILLTFLAEKQGTLKIVQPRTLPIFDIAIKTLVIGGGLYALLLAWHINVTGWLASAGILGLAIGFAAKDTLANLFAGVFILADAPYKLGDYVVVAEGQRGKVIDIGIRSTRILTRDDIEIVMPNSAIANGKIVNESGGPWTKRRIRIKVSAAYGTDLELVRKTLLEAADKDQGIVEDPEPRVRFRSFGDSGLEFELLCWVDEPEARGRVTDRLNTTVYNRFNEAGIEIPYTKHDVYLHQAG